MGISYENEVDAETKRKIECWKEKLYKGKSGFARNTPWTDEEKNNVLEMLGFKDYEPGTKPPKGSK